MIAIAFANADEAKTMYKKVTGRKITTGMSCVYRASSLRRLICF